MISNKNRFVLSFLEKDNHDIAFKEEMLCDENTGEILIRTNDGDIASYDALSRFKHHLDNFSTIANMYNIHGNMYKITNDNTVFPCNVDRSTNLLDGDLLIDLHVGEFMLSIDYDCYEAEYGGVSTTPTPDMDVNIHCSIILSDDSSYGININIPISELQETIFNTNNIIKNNMVVSQLVIDNISFTQTSTRTHKRIVVNSVLIAISEEQVGSYGAKNKDWKYDTVDETNITITKYIGTDKNIIVPDIIDGMTVQNINGSAFDNVVTNAIIIPDSIAKIY